MIRNSQKAEMCLPFPEPATPGNRLQAETTSAHLLKFIIYQTHHHPRNKGEKILPTTTTNTLTTTIIIIITFPVLFISSSRLSSLAEPGLGAPLSSYLEG